MAAGLKDARDARFANPVTDLGKQHSVGIRLGSAVPQILAKRLNIDQHRTLSTFVPKLDFGDDENPSKSLKNRSA